MKRFLHRSLISPERHPPETAARSLRSLSLSPFAALCPPATVYRAFITFMATALQALGVVASNDSCTSSADATASHTAATRVTPRATARPHAAIR